MSHDLWSLTLGPFSACNLNGVKTDSRSLDLPLLKTPFLFDHNEFLGSLQIPP